MTRTKLLCRIYYHMNNSKLHTKTITSLSNHLLEEDHDGNYEGVYILHKEIIKFRRNVLVGIYIFNNIDVMNKQNEIGIVGKIYADPLEKLQYVFQIVYMIC